MEIAWETVKKNLGAMHVSYQEREADPSLAAFIAQCGYRAFPMLVNVSSLEEVQADLGVLVAHQDEEVNNGVYVFCVLNDHNLALITVIPSTVSKGPLIRRLSGELTDAITGVILPPLTPFDMVELTGQILANTVMKQVMSAQGIPKEKEQVFTCLYLPRFLADVAMYYTGAAGKDGKPLVNEEIVDMEPARIRQMMVSEPLPEIFKQKVGEETCSEKHTEGSDLPA